MTSKNENESQDANLVLVEVNGQTLSAHELNEIVEAQMAQHGNSLKAEQISDAIRHFRAHAVRDFITQVLLEGETAARQIAVPPAEVEKALKDVSGRLPPGTALKEALAAGGMTLEMFTARLEKELRVRELVNTVMAKVPAVTEAEAEAFYAKETGSMTGPETVSARHILVMSDAKDSAQVKAEKRARIEGLRGELRAGADFAALAKAHSECPSAQEGGSLGSFGRGQMVKPFEEAAFSQPLSTVGEVVETPFGFHLIEVTAREDGSMRSFAECKDQILEHLAQRRKQEAFMAFINVLQASATISMDPSIEEEIEQAEKE